MIRKYILDFDKKNMTANAEIIGITFSHMTRIFKMKVEREGRKLFYQKRLTRYEMGYLNGMISGLENAGYGDDDA